MANSKRGYTTTYGLEVFVNKQNEITIMSSEDTGGPFVYEVSIPIERVDDICRWLQECKQDAIEYREMEEADETEDDAKSENNGEINLRRHGLSDSQPSDN